MSKQNLSGVSLQVPENSKLLEKLERLELENLALRLKLSKLNVALENFQKTQDPVFLEIAKMYQ